MATPKTGSVYTYSADPSKAPHPALADLQADAEVTVNSADKDQVRVGWTDATGMPREASVPADAFAGSFAKKA
jgi:hypothetical protein